VTGEILEQRRERIPDPRIRPLVDAEHLVTVSEEADREIRSDLS